MNFDMKMAESDVTPTSSSTAGEMGMEIDSDDATLSGLAIYTGETGLALPADPYFPLRPVIRCGQCVEIVNHDQSSGRYIVKFSDGSMGSVEAKFLKADEQAK